MPTITAVFDDRATAERAAEALVFRFQIDRADVFASDENDPDGQVAWQRLASRGIPQGDRHFFHEAIGRGSAVVVADVDAARAEEAMDVMESHGSVDLDDREQSWRSSGWTGASSYGGDAVFTGGSAAGLVEPRGTRSNPADSDPPGTMLSRGADEVLGTNISGAHPENEGRSGSTGMSSTTGHGLTGASDDPPGTMASRGVDDALGTNISGARPEHETSSTETRHLSGGASAGTGMGRDESIPIVEERLRVGKREVTHGRVRIRSYVVETPVEEQVSLREERVQVERHAVDRPVTDADRLFQERTIEATETAEEAVVAKEARVREELTIRKEATERTETVRDTVRRTEVEVEDDRTVGGAVPGSTSSTTGLPRSGA